MKRSVYKLLSILMAITTVFAVFSVDSIATVQDYSGFAAYINGDIKLSGTSTIEGDTVSVQGDVDLTNSDTSNKIHGALYISDDAELITKHKNDKIVEQITGGIVRGSEKTYSNDMYEFPEALELDHAGSFESKWGGDTNVISQSSAYDTFKITAPVTFDTREGDLIITADEFIFNGGKPDIAGEGRLIIFANKLEFKNSFQFTHNGDRDKVHIFVETGDLNISNYVNLTANLYFKQGSVNFSAAGSNIYGNIVAGGSSVTITNNTKIYGAVFAPNAAADIKSSGRIEGSLLADSLKMIGQAKIIYQDYSINIPDTLFPTPEPTLAPTPEPTAEPTLEPTAEPTAEPTPEPSSTPTPPVDDIPDGPPVVLDFPYAYLYGYSDGYAAPDERIKRQEAAALVYRLLKQNNKLGGFVRPSTPTYADLPSSDWSYSALEYMTYIGVYKGLDIIYPWESISRGEVAKIIAFSLRIRPDSSRTISFSDLPEDHPHYIYIKALVDNSYFIGYDDDTIRPDAPMTRAEFVTMLNRIIGRGELYYIDDVECPYPDLEGHWSYPYMMRASFGFTDVKNENGFYTVDPSRKLDRKLIDYS